MVGANLAAAVALHARDAGGPAIAHQLLAYPVTDSRMDSASYSELATDLGLGRDELRWFWDCYVPEGGAVSREDVRVNPVHASDLSGLPSAQLITAEYEPLRDEDMVEFGLSHGDWIRLFRENGLDVEELIELTSRRIRRRGIRS